MADTDLQLSWHLDRLSARALANGTHDNPFAVLGPHDVEGGRIIRAFLPGALKAEVLRGDGSTLAPLEAAAESGLFENLLCERVPYRLRITWPNAVQETEDPYAFDLLLGDLDLHLFNEGRHFELAHALGAQSISIDGVKGVRFAVWAPNAKRVAVVGDFNSWDRCRHPMRVRHRAGIWELFIPRIAPGSRYKYDIVDANGVVLPWKSDPMARQAEPPPQTASIVAQPDQYRWRDAEWMQTRGRRQATDAPIAIYEIHLPSWLMAEQEAHEASLWDVAVERLIPYLVKMGFTHLELLPIAEYPFGGSWGYQPLGLFAPSGRFGSPQGLIGEHHGREVAAGAVVLGGERDLVPGAGHRDAPDKGLSIGDTPLLHLVPDHRADDKGPAGPVSGEGDNAAVRVGRQPAELDGHRPDGQRG